MRTRPILLILLVPALLGCERLHHSVQGSHEPFFKENAEAIAEVEGAERWTEHLATVASTAGSFRVVARPEELKQKSCAQCHEKVATLPAIEVKEGTGAAPRRAHWQIDKPHGAAEGLSCETCHAGDDRATLRTLEGRKVEFDHAYELCGSCHFEQLRDWKGGAHGKRMHAWAGERVVENCTGCHDPHDPLFDVRLPKSVTEANVNGEGMQ